MRHSSKTFAPVLYQRLAHDWRTRACNFCDLAPVRQSFFTIGLEHWSGAEILTFAGARRCPLLSGARG